MKDTTTNGIVNILKPAGMTSHDVVGKLRKIYHTRKVGHTGTLDGAVCRRHSAGAADVFGHKKGRTAVI